MEAPDTGPPVVALPEPVDRRVRLGPFPSARDALKFVCYAAVGAVLAPFATPYAWLPVLGIGFAVSVGRVDGEAVDERLARRLVWRLQRWGGGTVTPPPSSPPLRGSVARLAGGSLVTVVRTGGTPLAYRPPEELGGLFDRFRELLRASEGPLIIRSSTVPLREGSVLPAVTGDSGADHAARTGYRELVSVLCRRRRARRVEIFLGASTPGRDGKARLEDRTRSLVAQLAGLGLRPTSLRDRALADSVRQFGWKHAGAPD
jgi:hypothetical protein